MDRSASALRVFISYARTDEALKNELQTHLAFLQRAGQVDVWTDRDIRAGENWRERIDENLNRANLILLLVSPAFAASSYCWSIETRRALERHQAGEATVVPVILHPAAGWQDTALGALQALPRGGKAISSWASPALGFQDVVEGLKELLEGASSRARFQPELVKWTVTTAGGAVDRQELSIVLRTSAQDLLLDLLDVSASAEELRLESTREGYDKISALHAHGKLSSAIGLEVRSVSAAIGAVLRIEARPGDGDETTAGITYLPEIFGPEKLGARMPPLVTGLAFPLNNPLQLGFTLATDPKDPDLSLPEQQKLQARLGHYLNNFLIARDVSVTLSPWEEYCGLGKALRRTQLGRDLLAQDVLLKYHAACLMYPEEEVGAAFWREIEGHEILESCLRVWIVPDGASVNVSSRDGVAHVDLEKMRLKTLCEVDYHPAAKIQRQESSDARVLDAFKTSILPLLNREVNEGPKFGILRQIYSVSIFAKWMRESSLGEWLKRGGLLDCDNPAKFGLEIAGDEVLRLRDQYLVMFRDGVWRCGRTEYDPAAGIVRKRIYIAGGVDLTGSP